jgi:hypothetical protein
VEVLISPHADEQIRNRKLTRERVIHVASEPEQTIPGTKNRYFAQSRYQEGEKEYLLRVLVEQVGNELRVITVYPTSKVRKYWRGE